MMKKILLTFILLFSGLCSALAWTYTFKEDNNHTVISAITIGDNESNVNIVIPDKVTYSTGVTKNVQGILSGVFRDCKNKLKIRSVTLPENGAFFFINHEAFKGCTNLLSINIPSTMGKITDSNDEGLRRNAFDGCTSLNTVTINSQTLMSSSNSSKGVGDAFVYARTINLGDNVTSIAGYSFYRSDADLQLRTITFSDNLKSIGQNAFQNAKLIEKIDLKNVDYLGTDVFKGCDALQEVSFAKLTSDANFPSTVRIYRINEIPNIGYRNQLKLSNPNLETIYFGPNVTRIPHELFSYTGSLYANKVCQKVWHIDCAYEGIVIDFNAFSGLKNLAIFKGKPSIIDERAFSGCSKLKSNILDNNLNFELCTKIGMNAFEGCTLFDLGLGSNNTPLENLTSVGSQAFKDCVNLPRINIPNAEVGSRAFSGCTTISSATVKTIQYTEKVFESCTNLKDITFCSDIPAQKFNDNMSQKIGTIVENINFSDEVTSIGDYAFYGYGVTNVSFNKVKTIGEEAFAGCTNLTIANGLSNVETIGKGVFYNCKNLKGDNIRGISMGNITKIPDNAFYGCSSLTTLTASNVTEIGEYAFEGCTKLSGIYNITSKENVTIGKRAFYGCTALQYNPVKNAKSIGQLAFYNCSKLSQPRLENTETIGAGAFENCTNLTSLWSTDLQKVVSIGYGAFENTGISSVSLPNTLTELGNKAFPKVVDVTLNCPELLKKKYGEDGNLLHCFGFANGIGSIKIGDDVTEIGNYAFYNKTDTLKLKYIWIGDGVKSLGIGAFYGLNATDYIHVGSSLNMTSVVAYQDDYKISMTCDNRVEIFNALLSSSSISKEKNYHTLFGKKVKNYVFGIGYNKYNTTMIAENAFYTEEETALESVWFQIEPSISNPYLGIQNDAFNGNRNLKSIPLNLAYFIGNRAFKNCVSLSWLVIGTADSESQSGTTQIGEYAFDGCRSLQTIQIKASNNAVKISETAFANVDPYMMLDMSDQAVLPNATAGKTLFITNKEARANVLRAEKDKFGFKKYSYVTSVQRMECEPADVDMNGKTTGADAQAVYNSMK